MFFLKYDVNPTQILYQGILKSWIQLSKFLNLLCLFLKKKKKKKKLCYNSEEKFLVWEIFSH
jgi:hypothetical protein